MMLRMEKKKESKGLRFTKKALCKHCRERSLLKVSHDIYSDKTGTIKPQKKNKKIAVIKREGGWHTSKQTCSPIVLTNSQSII